MDRQQSVISAALLAIGLALSGWFIGHGWIQARLSSRSVTVKGISEREVRADLAIWLLRVVVSGDDLGQAQRQLEIHIGQVYEFLNRHGMDKSHTELQNFEVADALADPYRPPAGTGNRYVIRQSVVVRYDNPETVLTASQKVGELVSAGIVLTSGVDYGASGPTFIFTKLSDLKPQMIAEATARARTAAEQFALDSHSRLGGIRTANQGVFEILARNPAPGIEERNEIVKKVRVVSTVDYFLGD